MMQNLRILGLFLSSKSQCFIECVVEEEAICKLDILIFSVMYLISYVDDLAHYRKFPFLFLTIK